MPCVTINYTVRYVGPYMAIKAVRCRVIYKAMIPVRCGGPYVAILPIRYVGVYAAIIPNRNGGPNIPLLPVIAEVPLWPLYQSGIGDPF
jgi:hypothetical protein